MQVFHSGPSTPPRSRTSRMSHSLGETSSKDWRNTSTLWHIGNLIVSWGIKTAWHYLSLVLTVHWGPTGAIAKQVSITQQTKGIGSPEVLGARKQVLESKLSLFLIHRPWWVKCAYSSLAIYHHNQSRGFIAIRGLAAKPM